MGKRVLPHFAQQAALSSILVACATGASAAIVTTSFQVTATVDPQCILSAIDLAFGAVDPLGGNVDRTTTLTVRCTKNTAYTVGINAGTVSGSTIANRLMANGANTMQYQLYSDTARTTIWGNSGGSWVSGTGAGMGAAQTLTVYGRVPSGQTNLAVGSYAEPTVTVTITY